MDMQLIEAEVQRLIKQGPPKKANAEPLPLAICNLCGGYKRGPIGMGDFFCRCEAARRKAILLLNTVDPGISMTFDTFKGESDSQIRALETAKGISGRGIAMFGRPGLGKTHLAISICRELFDNGGVFGYYNVVSLVSRIQSSYSGEGYDSRTSIIEEAARRQLVVLDDLGKEHRSANVDSIIYELIDTLYARKRLLVLCSNLPSNEYADRYDEAVRSRIAGMCDVVVIQGRDRRRA